MKADDYVVLQPGVTARNMTSAWAEQFRNAVIPEPGRYEIWMTYAFCSHRGRGIPLGQDSTRDDVHYGLHSSNAVRVVVRRSPIAPLTPPSAAGARDPWPDDPLLP